MGIYVCLCIRGEGGNVVGGPMLSYQGRDTQPLSLSNGIGGCRDEQ